MKRQQPQEKKSHYQNLNHDEQRLKRFHELYAKYQENKFHIPEEVQWKFNFIAARILKQRLNFTKRQQIQQIADLQDLPPKALIVIFNSLAKTFFQQGHIAISKGVEHEDAYINRTKKTGQLGFKKKPENNAIQKVQQGNSEQACETLPEQIVIKCKIRFPGIFAKFWKQGQMKIQSSKNSILVGKTGKAIRLNLTVKENKNNPMGKIILQTDIELNKIDDRTVSIIQDKKEVKIWVKFKSIESCDRFIKIYKTLYLRLIKQHQSLLVEKRKAQKNSPKKVGQDFNFTALTNEQQVAILQPKLDKLDLNYTEKKQNQADLSESLRLKKIQIQPNKSARNELDRQSPERNQRSFRTPHQNQIKENIQVQPDTMQRSSCFQKDQNFQIIKFQKNCIIKMHKTNAQIRIQLQTGINDSIEQIMSVILNQKGWNTQIKSELIMNKLDTNVFLVKRVYKPYSKLSYERQTFSLIEFEKLNSRRGLLMEETVSDQAQTHNFEKLVDTTKQTNAQKSNSPSKQKTVRADIKTVIFFELIQQKNKIDSRTYSNNQHPRSKLIIESSFKGNGYCSVADNRGMLLQIFQNIVFFEDHYLITKMKNSPQRKTLVKVGQSSCSNEHGKKPLAKRERYLDCSQNEQDSEQDQKQFNQKMRKVMVLETDQNELKRNSLRSYKSASMSQSIATVKTDFTQLTTKQVQIKRFHQLRPLKACQKVQQEYLQLLKKQLYENLYLEIIKNYKKGAEFDQNKEYNMFKKKQDNRVFNNQEKQQKMMVPTNIQKNNIKGRFIINERKQVWDQTTPWYCLQGLLQKKGQYEITQDKELVMVNYHLIESQKGTLTFIIKQIGVNLISGKGVMNISLPVDIFQPQSLLQRSAASFGYAPHYLQPICQKDPIQQMKSIFAFIASIPTLQLNMMKPFNPILGETFQAYIKGIPIFYQQISHHPPISSYFMQCQQFKLYGNLVAYADLGLNSAVGGNSGAMHIELKNGSHFQCYFPPCQIAGLIYGKRKFRAYGKGFIYQRKSGIFCQFSIEKEKRGVYQNQANKKLRQADLIGGIFRINEKFDKQFTAAKNNIRKFDGLSKSHIKQKLAKINGVWFETLYVNGQEILKGKPYPLEYHYVALPSDSNFRLDIMYHRIKNQARSQQQKEVLQNLQRTDRKLRQKHSKNSKKK